MGLPKDNLLFGFEPCLTDEQREYVNSIFDNQLTIVNAVAGSGKTTLAVACAKLLNKPLIYIFSPVEEGKLGFTPGELESKESKYLQPLIDALTEIGEDSRFAIYKKDDPKHINSVAWVYPKSHIFLRGSNIKDCTVIIDEAQNFTKGELRKVLTRIHDSCKVIMIGHSGQCDLPNPTLSGFVPYIDLFKDKPYAKVCTLTRNFRGVLATDADKI